MATKRELDAMLDNLAENSKPGRKKPAKPRKASSEEIDALISTINDEKKAAENVRKDNPNETTRVFGNKPSGEFEKKFGKKLPPLPDKPVQKPVYPSDDEPSPVKKKKMKVVISGELPDYEAIRQQELEKDKAEAEKSAQEKALEEKAAERKRLEEEMEAEKKRIAEKRAAESQKAEETAEPVKEETKENEFEIEEEEPVKTLEYADEEAEKLDEAIESISSLPQAKSVDEIEDFDDFKPSKKSAPKKKGFFAKIKSMFSGDVFDEDEQEMFANQPAPKKNKPTEEDAEPEDMHSDLFEQTEDTESAELVDAAMAAINDEPVVNTAETAEETVEEAVSEIEEQAEETAEEVIETAEETAEEITETVEETIETAEEEIAETVENTEETVEETAEEISETEENTDAVLEADDVTIEEITDDEEESSETAEESADENEEKSVLEEILDEDPEEILSTTAEKPVRRKKSGKLKLKKSRTQYAIIGIACALLAVIGLVTVISGLVSSLKNIGNANDKKSRFVNVVYPAAIMDISAFENPSELSSEEIITATIWSVVMDKNKIGKYESQLGDTVSIPDVDIEKYAVELFGENLPEFVHCTVGPIESRFYYSNGAYNVKLKPITFTYSPDVRSVVKSGSEYTLTVDYIDELPEWMPKSVAKTVEYKLTEQSGGSYTIDSMRIISVKSSNL